MTEIESALVVLVPEAERLVCAFRDQHDPAAAMGVPAHITLLYPFLHPTEINSAVIDDLSDCLARFKPFGFSFAKVRRFPGVVYLAPEPDDPFRALTLSIWNRFPEWPPYGGRHPDIVPHLSVAQLEDEHQLDTVAEEFIRASSWQLPLQAFTDEVVLMDSSAGRWQLRTKFPLKFNDR